MIPLMLQENYKPQGWRKSPQYWYQVCVRLYNAIAEPLTWDHCAGSRPDTGDSIVVSCAAHFSTNKVALCACNTIIELLLNNDACRVGMLCGTRRRMMTLRSSVDWTAW